MDKLPIRLRPHEKAGMSPIEVLLYEDLCYLARRTRGGAVKIPQRKLARRLGVARMSLIRARVGLERRGLLRYAPSGRSSALYQPLRPTPQDSGTCPESLEPLVSQVDQAGISPRPSVVSGLDQTGLPGRPAQYKGFARVPLSGPLRNTTTGQGDVASQFSGPVRKQPPAPIAQQEAAYTAPPPNVALPNGQPGQAPIAKTKSFEGESRRTASSTSALPEPGSVTKDEWIDAAETQVQRSRRTFWAEKHKDSFRS